MAATTVSSPAQILDKEQGILRKQTGELHIKSTPTENGVKEIVEGHLATTHVDQGNDQFTKQALEMMAQKINQDASTTIDAVYPDIKESQIGNVGHNNNPAAEEQLGFGDTRTVPAFKVTSASVTSLPDGEHALNVTGELMTDSQPADVEAAIKNAVNNGLLHSFSIEYIPTEVEPVRENGQVIRRIHESEPTGAALTGRPMNENANLTNRDLKTMAADNDKINLKNEEALSDDEGDEENNISPEQQDTTGKTMSEEENTEPEQDVEENDSAEEEAQETKTQVSELKESVEDLKSEFKTLKQENEELESENEELKAKIEDFKTVEGIDEDIAEIKSMIEDSSISLEEEDSTPQVEQGQERKSVSDDKELWQKTLDAVKKPYDYLKRESGTGKTNLEMIKSEYGVTEEEVKKYVRA